MKDNGLEIVYVSVDELRPSEYNPRRATDKEYDDVRRSIERFGLVDPIIVNGAENRKNVVIGGHLRLKVAKELGIKEVPVVYVNIPDIEKEKELNLRLNKNTGSWDWDLLANFDEGFLLDVGFTIDELEEVFQIDMSRMQEEDEDNIPAVAETTNIKTGDMFALGRHRLICGDSTQEETYIKLLGDKKANMVFTDPPYGVSYADKNSFLNKLDEGNRIQRPISGDHSTINELEDLLKSAFSHIYNALTDDGCYYITAPQGGDLLFVMMMMKEAKIPLKHMLIWVKNNHVLGRVDYMYKHEPILYGWKKAHKFYGKGEFTKSVWEINKPLKSDLHPTMKPVPLIVNAILNSTLRDEIVLDPFLGSGSTLIACEQTSRICYGIEIDPHYCDVIIKRWENYTGGKAEKIN